MRAWAETGRPIDEFWSLTFVEIATVFDAAANVRNREMDVAYYNAFMAGFFAQQRKKMPDYDKFAPRKSAPKPMTPDQMKTVAIMITAAMGGTIN